MLLAKKIKILRWSERFWFFILILCTVAVSWFYQTGMLSGQWLYISGGVLLFTLGLTLFISRKVDVGLSLLSSQVNILSDQESNLLYERSPVAYLTIDTNGIIVECNPAAAYLLRTEIKQLIGDNFFAFLLPTNTLDLALLQHKVKEGVVITDEDVSLSCPNKKEVWVLLSVYPHQDKQLRMIALVDVTERKVVDTAKSEFVALATHQLRTPIAAIRWNLELLKKSMPSDKSPEQERYFARIERNVLLMLNLISDFLNVAKLEMGTFATAVEPINLSTFLTTVLEEFAEKINTKQLQVVRSGESFDVSIETDRQLLHIIVSNLVSNAVKYLNNQGTLTISCQAVEGGLELSVADTGIGIPAAEIEKLFTKFYRASNAHTHQTQGTGLGLYVVKQSVEKLGGTISVTSKENEGTTFVVMLPITVMPDSSSVEPTPVVEV